MAPELINRAPYTEKIDVWSLGVITYQLLSGKTPFESRNLKKIDWNILNKNVQFVTTKTENWTDISENAKHFISMCLNRDQKARPSI
jgi:serine/threonine protein kinase